MRLTLSRGLSLLVLAAAALRARGIDHGEAYVALCAAPALALIWFPSQIDEFTFGSWSRGNRIDTHTPPFLIAAFGWVFLLLFTWLLFEGRIVFSPARA